MSISPSLYSVLWACRTYDLIYAQHFDSDGKIRRISGLHALSATSTFKRMLFKITERNLLFFSSRHIGHMAQPAAVIYRYFHALAHGSSPSSSEFCG